MEKFHWDDCWCQQQNSWLLFIVSLTCFLERSNVEVIEEQIFSLRVLLVHGYEEVLLFRVDFFNSAYEDDE